MNATELVEPRPPGPLAYSYLRSGDRSPAHARRWAAAHEEPIRRFINDSLALRGGVSFGGYFRDLLEDGLEPISKRPAGKVLQQALSAGDHVVTWDLEHAFAGQRDLSVTLRRWDARGINCTVMRLQPLKTDTLLEVVVRLEAFDQKMAALAIHLDHHPRHTTIVGIMQGCLDRKLTWREVAVELNARTIRTRLGGKWTGPTAKNWWQSALLFGKRPPDTAPEPVRTP